MNKVFLILFSILLPSLIHCQSKSYNEIQIGFINKKELKNAGISLYAENIKSGKTIMDHNSDISLIPASVFKIFPTSIALELFEPDHKFKTELAYSGVISKEGVLNGNIYIIGYGDPCLGSENFSSHYNKNGQLLDLWANEVKKMGIKKINGNIIADISYFGEINIHDKWIWEDIANYYGHQGSALNYYDNLYHVHFSTGNYDGSKTSITKIVPENTGISFENYVTSSSSTGDDAYIYPGNNNKERIIRGTLPWKRDNYVIKGSMPEPELFLVRNFTEKLKNNGIEVSGTQILISETDKNIKKVIHTTYSPELQEIAKITNIKSNNLYAEVLGHHISKITGKKYKDAVTDFLRSKNISTEGLNVDDACGLSHFNTLTSKQMSEFLKYLEKSSPQYNYFFKTLPVSGINGTLLTSYKDTRWSVHAKSGSMTRVRGYAGYIINKSGEKIVFCFIVNNYNCSSTQMRKIFEEMFKNIAEK
ncbi:MAG: D-alanyl-D-alanine carboxypeptidase/D-alanyl-D-alanine-endopeptidase [Bacteroidales bacterium]|jgi:D-alanyl-D-alanine carboxypeptidase/D-alanyl-D-alanine-endopeptidase (penicillin-binding protein 4)|nr:D-alanyl-D-alanine carboxypeptidase/D-alanyl-D-alanine-endopeptidase [Bacteroidales bacterium]